MEHPTVSKRQTQRPQRRRVRRHFTALILGAFLFGGAIATAPPPSSLAPTAQAIDNHHGPGVNWGNGIHLHGAGAFVVEGKYVYCAEPWIRSGPAVPSFVGSSTIPGNSSDGVSVATTEGTPLQQITFIITRYGQTNDNFQAAAVALAVWEIRGTEGRGNAGYLAEIARVRNSVGPDVVALSQRFVADSASWVSARQSSKSSSGSAKITVSPTGPYSGSVAVPVGTLSLQIENGVFSDGTTSRSWDGVGSPVGTSLSWQGLPPASGWDKYYRVSFTGSYLEIPTTVLWGDGGNSQSSVSVEAPEIRPFELTIADLDTTWAPEVSSLVSSRFLSIGEQHSDEITFAAAPAAQGTNGEWRWRALADGSREWMPIKAKVTAYGPYLTDPALNPSFEAPVGAPVAARGTFTTDPTRDHSTPQTYSFQFEEAILEQGYYTYKWDIDGTDQDPSVTGIDDCLAPNIEAGCRVLPKSYFFSDGFGTVGETQVGKMRQTFTTKLATHETSLGESFTDDITIPEMQNWLRDDTGARIPLTLTGTAYLVAGPELAQSIGMPEHAVPLATMRVTTDPQLNGQVLKSEPVTIPISTPRMYQHVTMRWCIVDEDQLPHARGFWEERCDDFGVPEESARISHPEVRTEAQTRAIVGETITDTAIVDGPVPDGSELVFEAFKAPVAGDPKQDENGAPTATVWEQAEIDALNGEAVCTLQNRVGRTDPFPVKAGPNDEERYSSPGIQVNKAGTYWWIESLIHREPESGTETLLHSGTCGLQNETTFVEAPTPPPVPEQPKLAATGASQEETYGPLGWALLGSSGLIVAGGISMLIARRSRLKSATDAAGSGARSHQSTRECAG